MLDQIQDVIKQNLPEATAKQMSTFIQEAEADKVRLTSLERESQTQMNTINRQQTEISELKDLVKKEEVLIEKENDLTKREQALNLQIAEIKLDEALKRNESIENLVSKVFGHPSVTVCNSRDVYTPVPVNDQGMTGVVQRDQVFESTTTTENKV